MRSWLALGLLLTLGCAHEGQVPAAWDASAVQSLRIPGGKRCLSVLDQLGVKYEKLSPRGRVKTPVAIHGAIAGITYKPTLVCDCRLALALHWSAPVLGQWHISEVEHFGAYSNRTTRRGRPSLHAQGLALDVARLKFPDARLDVASRYERGWGAGCGPNAPALNRVVCQLRQLGLFRELITPDHDADHQDHVHIGILPL
jgi:hypothetical protein